MANATLIVLLALLQFVWFSARVGMARGKYKIEAPACSGDENFERLFRVQMNTLEQLVVFIPAMYAFAFYLSPLWVLVPGVVWLLGRFLYSAAYITDPKTRGPGMGFTLFANIVLILGAMYGVIESML